MKEVVLKSRINESMDATVGSPIDDILNSTNLMTEIEDKIFNLIQNLEDEYPEYEDFKYQLQEHSGLYFYELIGFAKPLMVHTQPVNIAPNPTATWKRRDGSIIKISDMTDKHIENSINMSNGKILKATDTKEQNFWKEQITNLQAELDFRQAAKLSAHSSPVFGSSKSIEEESEFEDENVDFDLDEEETF